MSGVVSRDRRRFLTAGAAAVGAAASGQVLLAGTARAAQSPLPAGVFSLGVASGDPLPDGVVLWTRLAPDPLHGGGMPARAVPVEWQISEDSRFGGRSVAATPGPGPSTGTACTPTYGGCVPTGTTGTGSGRRAALARSGGPVPLPPRPPRRSRLRLALASCQNWQHGYFTPYADMRAQDPDLVVFVGDYIYESTSSIVSLRNHEGTGEPFSLVQYRNRYAQYQQRSAPRSDARHRALRRHLRRPRGRQRLRRGQPSGSRQTVPRGIPRADHRRLPGLLRAHARTRDGRAQRAAHPDAPAARLRAARARLNVLDTRQFRSNQATSQAGAQDPAMTMLGARAEAVAAGRAARVAGAVEPDRLTDHDGRDRPARSATARNGSTTPGTATRSNATRCSPSSPASKTPSSSAATVTSP